MTYINALMGFFVYSNAVVAPAPLPVTPVLEGTTTVATIDMVEKLSALPPQDFTVSMTAYNAVPEQTDDTPFTTGSGAFSNPEVIAARSADLRTHLPYGTVIKVTTAPIDSNNCNFSVIEPQIGYRVIADAMNPRIHNTVDLLLDQTKVVTVGKRTLNPAIALGKCHEVVITVVGKLAVKDIPATQAELKALVENPEVAFNK
jgi:3D (Asp-Asp-Asp) domain-containing protein